MPDSYQLKIRVVGCVIDDRQVGPDAALPPFARQRVIEIAAGQRLIRGRQVQHLHQKGVQPPVLMP
jgi:hypothetical protein